MKKILFFSHYSTHAGLDGANKVLMQTALGISNRKFKKIVVTPRQGVLSQYLASGGIEEKTMNYDCDALNRVIYNTANKEDGGINYEKIENALKNLQIYRIFKEWKPDIVYANTIMSIPAAILGRAIGARVVWHIHEIISNHLGEEDKRTLYKLINKYSDKIIVIGKAVKSSLEIIGKSPRCELIYNGVENHGYRQDELRQMSRAIRTHMGLKDRTPFAAYLGTISPHKGIDRFILAADLVLRKEPDSRFIIVGDPNRDPPHTQYLKKLIKDLGREREIKLGGYCSNLSKILPAIDCLVVPSVYEEPFGLVNVEANLYFKPVIAFNNGGIGEAIINGKNGFLVPSDNIDYLAANMYKVMKDPETRDKMGYYGNHRAIARFGLSRYLQNIEEILDEVSRGQLNCNPCRHGSIIRGSGPMVYMIQKGKKRHIKNRRVMDKLGLDWSDVVTINDDVLSAIPLGKPLE